MNRRRQAKLRHLPVAREPRERRGLQRPAGAVVVLGVHFVKPVFVRRHPSQVFGEPGHGAVQAILADASGLPEPHQGLRDLDQVEGVDDADSPAGVPPLDGLGIEQVRVHFRLFVDEPGADLLLDRGGVSLLAREQEGRCQGADGAAEIDHRLPVLGEIVGIALAVPSDVRPVRILRIRPPVVPFGVEVVEAAGAALRDESRHGDGFPGEPFIGLPEHFRLQEVGYRTALAAVTAGARQCEYRA